MYEMKTTSVASLPLSLRERVGVRGPMSVEGQNMSVYPLQFGPLLKKQSHVSMNHQAHGIPVVEGCI
jgi:hypothetical protein